MTTFAQLHDCHSCNDERSFDQKKGPVFGPPTHEDAMIEDIHERRARVLEELNDRLQDAYNHGPEELA